LKIRYYESESYNKFSFVEFYKSAVNIINPELMLFEWINHLF